jgi:hypothetical protein
MTIFTWNVKVLSAIASVDLGLLFGFFFPDGGASFFSCCGGERPLMVSFAMVACLAYAALTTAAVSLSMASFSMAPPSPRVWTGCR